MLYILGLGLNEESYTKEAEKIIFKAEKVFLENYTVKFPYRKSALEKKFGKRILEVDRDFIESLKILDEAKKESVVLLIYGSPFFATTHISLINEAKKLGIKTKVVHNASVFDAIGVTGLQLYKFGKIASLPNFEAKSYVSVIKKNLEIGAHSLILVDINFGFNNALEKLLKDLNENSIKIEKIVVCSRLGTKKEKIYYSDIKKLKRIKVNEPFCFILPGNLHFLEEETLNNFCV
jgi:diphthine synthase